MSLRDEIAADFDLPEIINDFMDPIFVTGKSIMALIVKGENEMEIMYGGYEVEGSISLRIPRTQLKLINRDSLAPNEIIRYEGQDYQCSVEISKQSDPVFACKAVLIG